VKTHHIARTPPSMTCIHILATFIERFSTLDHFLISSSLVSSVSQFRVDRDVNNPLHHDPEFLSFDLEADQLIISPTQRLKKCAW
jgi:hypothetical protein